MSTFCFAESDGRYELFAYAMVRGMLAAIRDFPRFMGFEESEAQAVLECSVLRSEVCHVASEGDYERLFKSAYLSTYRSFKSDNEREISGLKMKLKDGLVEDIPSTIRYALADNEALRTMIDKAYAQYVEAINGHTAN